MKRSYLALALCCVSLGMIFGSSASASDGPAEVDHYLASVDEIASDEIDYNLEAAPALSGLATSEIYHYLDAPSLIAQIEDIGLYAMQSSQPKLEELDRYLAVAAPAVVSDEVDHYLDGADEVQPSRGHVGNNLVRQLMPNKRL